jgi:hypothetical protein
MNAFVEKEPLATSDWRRCFAETLIRLQPDMNPDAADELSDSACLRYVQVHPAEAALQYQRDSQSWAAGSIQARR